MDQLEAGSYDEFNLNFRMDDGIEINQNELALFNHEFAGNKALCQVTYMDNVRVLSYKVPATLPLSQFLKKQLYKAEFLSILSNIMKQLMFLEDSRMPLKKVLLNTKYMYIELSTMDVQLLYMPIEKEFVDCNICEFIQTFITKVRFADMQCVKCVDELLRYLDSKMMFSIRDFYDFVLKMEQDIILKDAEDEDEAETTVLSQIQYKNIVPYLVRIKSNALIAIEKNEFVIGKSPECDYQVTDNRRVSRKHCILRIHNGECYIRDLESTNHTYVNGKLIQPGYDVMLNNDDYIRLGDEEFKYWVR
ncbi:MAG: FHA domain-containing protein [Wujia sp.]